MGKKINRRKEYQRAWQFQKKYNITLDDHLLIYVHQNGCCAICKQATAYDKIDTDHNHKTGEIRGLLCRSCNLVLGKIKDNPQTLINAIEYLNK